ncbi:MAG TPA: HyaD/HybD family hydrogenase maturation endopeptidase [Steroidobacteraceae bacterium]
MKQSLVLGIGNALLSDDGAGVHCAQRLADILSSRDDVRVIDAGTLCFTLVPEIESAERLIVLDAAELTRAPGELQWFLDGQMDAFLARPRLSAHEIGLRDLMDIARLSAALPRERALIGIQPGSLGWGTELTPEVAKGIDAMVTLTLDLLQLWPGNEPWHPGTDDTALEGAP